MTLLSIAFSYRHSNFCWWVSGTLSKFSRFSIRMNGVDITSSMYNFTHGCIKAASRLHHGLPCVILWHYLVCFPRVYSHNTCVVRWGMHVTFFFLFVPAVDFLIVSLVPLLNSFHFKYKTVWSFQVRLTFSFHTSHRINHCYVLLVLLRMWLIIWCFSVFIPAVYCQ